MLHYERPERGFASPLQPAECGNLPARKAQDEFQTELDSVIIGNGIRDGPERTKRLGSKLVIVPSGVPQLRAVKGVPRTRPGIATSAIRESGSLNREKFEMD